MGTYPTFSWHNLNDAYLRRIDAFKSKSKEELSELANHEDLEVLSNVARNRNTSPETLDRLANSYNRRVHSWVAHNRNTPTETLDRLANHEDPNVRFGIALNPNTTSKTLARMSSDEWRLSDYLLCRCWIAKHPNTPPEILDAMLWDKEYMENYYTTYYNIHKKHLITDENFSCPLLLLYFILKNPNISNETLVKIIDGGFSGSETARRILGSRQNDYE